ncbi:hypothetical protein ACVWW3_003443 [Bradyrhizobium sp. LM2.9]
MKMKYISGTAKPSAWLAPMVRICRIKISVGSDVSISAPI